MAVVVVAYDISDDDRRRRLADDLLRMGFSRVQRSVYVYRRAYRGVALRAARAAARRIDPRTDTVLIITVPDRSFETAIILGGETRGTGLLEL